MMRYVFAILVFVTSFNCANGQLRLTEVGNLPMPVSNNAVCEGFINGQAFLYSFAGIDNSKSHSGIHLNSFRFDIATGEVIQLDDLPDTQGKIACAASRIDSIIYITGGYHVNSNGTEVSSRKLHRFNINTNQFLSNGADLLVATDDHVQGVWRDSLLYVITGWSNTSNISNVQIYNPHENKWVAGIPVPANDDFRSFGASGIIVGDTIYYYGGATSSGNFGIQNSLRMGIIDTNDPRLIDWSISTPDASLDGYRMGCTLVKDEIHWVGGSNETYNYDGIAYNNTGGVPTANQDLIFDYTLGTFEKKLVPLVPMDLRGIASINDSVKYIAGGMVEDQMVTDKIFRLEWSETFASNTEELQSSIIIGPNPCSDFIDITIVNSKDHLNGIELRGLNGRLFLKEDLKAQTIRIELASLPNQIYLLHVQSKSGVMVKKIVKMN